MTAAAMFGFPDFFKVGISESGNHDNSIYNRWWSEKHDGVKEVVKDDKVTFEYDIDKNQDIAKNLKGHLLLITGDIDNNVHPSNTYRVIDALIKANKRFDFILLPGQRHGYGAGSATTSSGAAIDYFSQWLLGVDADRHGHGRAGSGAADQEVDGIKLEVRSQKCEVSEDHASRAVTLHFSLLALNFSLDQNN